MSTYSAFDGVAVDGSRGSPIGDWLKSSGTGVAAAIAWVAFGLSCLWWPDIGDWSRTYALGIAAFVVAAFALFGTLSADFLDSAGPALRRRTPWLVALGLFFTVWELATAKFGWLPLPFFPPPQSILEVYTDDLPKLLDSVFASVKAATRRLCHWRDRRLPDWCFDRLVAERRLLGASSAALHRTAAGHRVASDRFFTFPSSWSASTFLIALATGFPVTVLTWSGVASVSSAYYDVARTLGAKPSFLVLKVAIPAALPHVFVGLFMGLGSSFAVLVVAEMIGVKAGLGWYLQWAQGWAAYANMYAALIVMSLLCSGAITLLFRTRDRLLVWQKGVVKW
jgi:NitT/TauT family transport system permease protein